MIEIITVLGVIATLFTLSSFMMKDIFHLRLVNAVGAFFWIAYGSLEDSLPVVVTNFFVLSIHSYWLLKNKFKDENSLK